MAVTLIKNTPFWPSISPDVSSTERPNASPTTLGSLPAPAKVGFLTFTALAVLTDTDLALAKPSTVFSVNPDLISSAFFWFLMIGKTLAEAFSTEDKPSLLILVTVATT